MRLALLLSSFLTLAVLLLLALISNPFTYENANEGVVVDQPPADAPTLKTSWLILPELPASATAADFGAEIYRLVCRDCHGDQGQGLTDGWRATWAPKDQNCWQSKCHASIHPPEGFELPHVIPAIMGPSSLTRFKMPADLYEFIRAKMPWHNPGSLTDQEYWQLTAYLVRENGRDLSGLP